MNQRHARMVIALGVLSVVATGVIACGPSKVVFEVPVPEVVPPPDIRTASLPSIEFLVIGDQGTGGSLQKEVAAGMTAFAARHGADFVLGLGDNFYGRGVGSTRDRQWQTKFESVYASPELQIPFHMTLGNHDYGRSPKAQVEYSKISSRWSMPDRYYQFSVSVTSDTQVDFFALDTVTLSRPQGDPEQVGWLEQELQDSTAQWKIVFGHHPVDTRGYHKRDKEILRMQPIAEILQEYQVDALFSGHDHDLQALRPVNGVYYFISGAAGKHRDVRWGPDTLFAWTNGGFIWSRITAMTMLVVICDKDGTPLWGMEIPQTGP